MWEADGCGAGRGARGVLVVFLITRTVLPCLCTTTMLRVFIPLPKLLAPNGNHNAQLTVWHFSHHILQEEPNWIEFFKPTAPAP